MLDGIDPDSLETIIGNKTLDPRVEDLDGVGVFSVEVLQGDDVIPQGTLLDVGLVAERKKSACVTPTSLLSRHSPGCYSRPPSRKGDTAQYC